MGSEEAPGPSKSVGQVLKDSAYRVGEGLHDVFRGAAWLPLQAAKLPGILEKMGRGLKQRQDKTPVEGYQTFKGKAERLESELEQTSEFMGQQAGGRSPYHAIPETIGSLIQPAPALPAIPKFLSKAAIKPAVQGAGVGAAYAGGVSAIDEIQKPSEKRDWWNVPKHMAIGGSIMPLFQRVAGAFSRIPGEKPPTVPSAKLPEGGGPGPLQPGPLPPTANRTVIPDELPELPMTGELGAVEPLPPASPREPLPEMPYDMPLGEHPLERTELAQDESSPIHDLGPESESYVPAAPSPTGRRALPDVPPDYVPPEIARKPFKDLVSEKEAELRDQLGIRNEPEPVPGQSKDFTSKVAGEQELIPGLPPPTIGERPIIGREAVPGEAPLFSKQAQTPEPEQIPLSPEGVPPSIEPVPDIPSGLVDPSNLDIASTPRHLLPREANEEILMRAMKGKADLEASLGERGGFTFDPNIGPGAGEKSAWKSAAPDWYRNLTTWPEHVKGMSARAKAEHVGARPLKPEQVNRALKLIEHDQGKDTGPIVERVKQELLADKEFSNSEWAKPAPTAQELESEVIASIEQREQGAFEQAVAEKQQEKGFLEEMGDILNNERGSVQLGGGVGPIERFTTIRRFAERHPDFAPIYQTAEQRSDFASAMKYDLHQIGKSYFTLSETDRVAVDKLLRDRRRLGRPIQIPQQYQQAVDSIDNMMKSAYDLINDVRSTKGLPAINQDPFYVPFARSGQYLTIAEIPGTNKRWVSASETLREAESLEKQLQGKFPGARTVVRMGGKLKGDHPQLDFGTLSQLESAGFISKDDVDKIVEQFDLPPGFGAHFRNAQKIFGESTELLDPIERYIDGLTSYSGRFLYDDVMKSQIMGLKDPSVRQFGESYRQYLNAKPIEYGRLRGAVATWDLMLNVGSMIQNASQVPLIGFPVLQSKVGAGPAAKIFKDSFALLRKPTPEIQQILQMAEREGHVKPINAEELFGAGSSEPTGVELGSPYIQRKMETGSIPPSIGKPIRKGLDLAAGGIEKVYDATANLNLKTGQGISYGLARARGLGQQQATERAQQAHGVLMQGFAWIEEANRRASLIQGYLAGQHLGLSPASAYEYAKKFSRDVNFDYSPKSRASMFRGKMAPLGLFMTFQTEALSTYSKLIRQQFANRSLLGPATTALAGFWTVAGLKGLPFVEDVDTYGPKPGAISDNLPDWAYQGPTSTATGRDFGAKFKLGPRVPYDMLHGEFDPSQIAVVQPFLNIAKGADWYRQSPMDPPSTQIAVERMLPPSLRHLAAAARWAGIGPAGEMEGGAVGTIRGHTPGPNPETGKGEFFHPSKTDIALKAATFTPLELSKGYARGRHDQVTRAREQSATTALVNQAAHHLDRNGMQVPSDALKKLAQEHPRTYRALIKAHNIKKHGKESASTEQIYRRMQEPKPKKNKGGVNAGTNR